MAEVVINIKAEDEATPVIEAISEALDALGSELAAMDAGLTKTLTLDVGGALAGASEVIAAIDAIPDVSEKVVLIEYQTMASPVRPFTEGIGYIREKMESLPTESTYTVKYNVAPNPALADNAGVAHAAPQAVTFAPSITINHQGGGASSDAASMARALDDELARMWRSNRSELRRAVMQ